MKTLIHEATEFVTFQMPSSCERKVMAGIMKHHIGREMVPLTEKFDFPKELKDAHHNAKASHAKPVTYRFYSDGSFDCEVLNR